MSMKRVQMNVNGVFYETLESTLHRFPQTLLGSPDSREKLHKSSTNVLQIRCNTCTFDAILFYYQSNGILTRPPSLAAEYFEEQCRYFAIDEKDIRKMKEREQLVLKDDDHQQVFMFDFQRKICEFLNHPRSSYRAWAYAIINCILILTSIVIACLQTSPDITSGKTKMKRDIFLIDLVLNGIFLVEYVICLLASPNKFKFCICALNVIDFLAIWPHFILQIMVLFHVPPVNWLKALPTLRILRLIRLGKQSTRLDFVFRILSNCLVDILTMILAVLVSAVFYASLVYYAEQTDELDTQFTSIPNALWWAIQTLIPLGYGDIVPRTVLGKITAGMVCILAAFSFTVPVLFLGGKFLGLYSKNFGVVLGDDFKSCDPK